MSLTASGEAARSNPNQPMIIGVLNIPCHRVDTIANDTPAEESACQ